MSVATPPTPPATSQGDNQIVIVSHSNLFYWWPVWAIGFLLGILSLIGGYRMVVVPKEAEVARSPNVTVPDKGGDTKNYQDREVLIMPKDEHLRTVDPDNPKSDLVQPKDYRHIARSRSYGVLFAMVLLLVIFITNVPLRGMWSVVAIVTIILLSVIFALAGWWEVIFRYLGYLDIRINAGGLIFISTGLFIVWLATFWFFDRQIYMIFTPGQLKVCTEIGGGEHVYDAVGMTLEKQRSDLFRHWILGLGSGDLVVKTSGAQAHQFDLPNVLFIGKKVQQIEEMLKKKVVEPR
jgi:hypothetical protein